MLRKYVELVVVLILLSSGCGVARSRYQTVASQTAELSVYRVNRYGDVFVGPIADSTWRRWSLFDTQIPISLGSCSEMRFLFVGDKHGRPTGERILTVAQTADDEFAVVLRRKVASGSGDGGLADECGVAVGTTVVMHAVD